MRKNGDKAIARRGRATLAVLPGDTRFAVRNYPEQRGVIRGMATDARKV
jgi:hypothetical protein